MTIAPPTFTDKRQSAREIIRKTRMFNQKMTELAKQAIAESHTGNIEGMLENLTMLVSGEYGDEEKVEIPIDLLRQMALFGAVTVSRMLEDRYKLEKSLGRPSVATPIVEPTVEDVLQVLQEEDLTEA